VGELSGASSALALNANLNPRCSWSTVQAYFIEKLVSSRLMNVRHELPTTSLTIPDMSGYARLTGHLKIVGFDEIIGAATVNPDDAAVLQAAPGSAVLLIKETTYDGSETPIEYSVSVLCRDRYTAFVISVPKK